MAEGNSIAESKMEQWRKEDLSHSGRFKTTHHGLRGHGLPGAGFRRSRYCS